MNRNTGAEDTPEWKNDRAVENKPLADICRHCSERLTKPHCANRGCQWCKQCADEKRVGARS